MAAQLFTKIQKQAEAAGMGGIASRSKVSTKWFIDNLKNIRNVSRKTLLKDDRLVEKSKGLLGQQPLIGRMFMYFYDPKTKDDMPYYDRFPLIIMVGPAEGGFYGLNMHYLHPRARAVFFDLLLEHTNNNKYDHTTKIRLTYEMLMASRKLRMFKPCFKRYLFKQIRSKTVEVPASDWEIALYLPTDDFAKEDRTTIWNESKKYQIK